MVCTKLKDVNAGRLIQVIGKAKGNIYLITDDGNRLNLNSRLCRMFGIENLIRQAGDSKISAELSVENPEDELMLINDLMRKPQPSFSK